MSAPEMGDGVTFTLGLDTVVSVETEWASDGEPTGSHPVTLADRVAAIIAERLISAAGKDWYPQVNLKADEIAARLVEERFRAVLEREIVPTDRYGQPKGEPTTLAEVIVKRAEEWLTTKPKSDTYGRQDGKTNLQTIIDEAVGNRFKSEVQAAVKDARSAATAEVSRQAADVFAEIIRKAAKA